MPSTNIIFLIGVSGSGKSYQAARLFPNHTHLTMGHYQNLLWDEHTASGGAPSISSSDYRQQLFRANELLLADALKHIGMGEPVVIEGTFYKAKRRIAFTDAIKKITNEPMDIYLVSPSETRFRENLRLRHLEEEQDLLREERKQIEFPNRAEGFAHVFELRDDGQPVEDTRPAELDIVARAREELAEEAWKEESASKRRQILQELKDGKLRFLHVCEVCGKRAWLTPQTAFDQGWDYPPVMGVFHGISPRTCGECTINHTLWWAMVMEKTPPEHLTPAQKATMVRILGEPWNLLDESDSGLDL